MRFVDVRVYIKADNDKKMARSKMTRKRKKRMHHISSTSSGNPVYIPSVAKTNNFSKLSVCCRNKNSPTEPNQETKLKSQQKHRKRIN